MTARPREHAVEARDILRPYVDSDIAHLVREERLLEAAQLASKRGDAGLASSLFERACEWASAAGEAMRAGMHARALELAVEGGVAETAERAVALVAPNASIADAVATRLAARGRHAWAARVLEAAGRTLDSAREWERAGDAGHAAAMLDRGGEPAGAARVLEAALRRDPQAWPIAVVLGGLLARYGKSEAAVRVLQRVPAGAPERRDALVHLVPALERLGLERASTDAAAELAARGGAPALEDPARVASEGVLHPRLFGRYDLMREVASSPSARVLECVDVVRAERVAVKVFAAYDARGTGRDALARFEREVRAMRALDHPSVVPLRDFIAEGPAIVFMWMGGGTLEKMLSSGPLAPARAVEIACAVLSALGDAHRLGILHRDVKPANVLFDDAGAARLSDFGVAHLGDASATTTAGVFGTLAYMSPEQREGRPATARSDVFSVGVMLREMITGERPSPTEAPRSRPSEAHRELDARHDAVVARLADTDADVRPADAFEARMALLALPWPGAVDANAPRAPAEKMPSGHPAAGRVESDADGRVVDGWTGRAIERVALDERVLMRARAFSLADHPSLQTVLRVEHADQTLWLEAARGRPLDRALAADERARLVAALEALHRRGIVHGSVDREHLRITGEGVVLRFSPGCDPTATVDRDRLWLARLG
jgi:tRNA A-37 threonylcarbamoyl transferase component Bud32